MVRKITKVKTTCGDTMWKSLNWVVISSEKNWRLQLDVSISMLWSSSGECKINVVHCLPIVTSVWTPICWPIYTFIISSAGKGFHNTVLIKKLINQSKTCCVYSCYVIEFDYLFWGVVLRVARNWDTRWSDIGNDRSISWQIRLDCMYCLGYLLWFICD